MGRQKWVDPCRLDSAGRLEVVPHDHRGMFLERLCEQQNLLFAICGDKFLAEQGCAHGVQDELGAADVVEGQPQAAAAEPAGLRQPPDEAAGSLSLPSDMRRTRKAGGSLSFTWVMMRVFTACRILEKKTPSRPDTDPQGDSNDRGPEFAGGRSAAVVRSTNSRSHAERRVEWTGCSTEFA